MAAQRDALVALDGVLQLLLQTGDIARGRVVGAQFYWGGGAEGIQGDYLVYFGLIGVEERAEMEERNTFRNRIGIKHSTWIFYKNSKIN